MLGAIVIILIILWLLGFVTIPGVVIPNITLFTIFNHTVTLFEALIFILILLALGLLPQILRVFVVVLVVLWVLSIFGILAVAGLSNIIFLAIVVSLIISIFTT